MIEWTEKYGFHRTRIGLLRVLVAWSSGSNKEPGYYVSVSGDGTTSLNKPFKDLTTAKIVAIELARRKAQEVLDAISAAKEQSGDDHSND